MKINIKAVLAKEEERKAEVKPLPTIVIVRKPSASVGKLELSTGKVFDAALQKVPPEVKKQVDEQDEKNALLAILYAEISTIKTERGILSTDTAHLVLRVRDKLMEESPSLAKAFMDGDLADLQIKEHYEKIQALSDWAKDVWDKIQFVDKYGKLPGDPEAPKLEENAEDVSAIKYEITRLKDRIHKTKKKLEGKPPSNPSRLAMWKQKLAMDEAERADLKQKLNRLEYGA